MRPYGESHRQGGASDRRLAVSARYRRVKRKAEIAARKRAPKKAERRRATRGSSASDEGVDRRAPLLDGRHRGCRGLGIRPASATYRPRGSRATGEVTMTHIEGENESSIRLKRAPQIEPATAVRSHGVSGSAREAHDDAAERPALPGVQAGGAAMASTSPRQPVDLPGASHDGPLRAGQVWELTEPAAPRYRRCHPSSTSGSRRSPRTRTRASSSWSRPCPTSAPQRSTSRTATSSSCANVVDDVEGFLCR